MANPPYAADPANYAGLCKSGFIINPTAMQKGLAASTISLYLPSLAGRIYTERPPVRPPAHVRCPRRAEPPDFLPPRTGKSTDPPADPFSQPFPSSDLLSLRPRFPHLYPLQLSQPWAFRNGADGGQSGEMPPHILASYLAAHPIGRAV